MVLTGYLSFGDTFAISSIYTRIHNQPNFKRLLIKKMFLILHIYKYLHRNVYRKCSTPEYIVLLKSTISETKEESQLRNVC